MTHVENDLTPMLDRQEASWYLPGSLQPWETLGLNLTLWNQALDAKGMVVPEAMAMAAAVCVFL